MRRSQRPVVIPTQGRGVSLWKVLAGMALLSGVALAGVLVGLRLVEPLDGPSSVELPMQGLAAPGAGPAVAEERPASQQPATEAPPRAGTAPRPPQPQAAQTQAPAALACADCGLVESVLPRARSAPATGVGAVAGGVVGGLLGNQLGKGGGRRAMTVVGAVGGGLVGHEIEKQQRSQTEYLVRVRMADGSLRERVQAQPLPIGSAVRVGETGLQLLERAR